jgi:hypothetical protein
MADVFASAFEQVTPGGGVDFVPQPNAEMVRDAAYAPADNAVLPFMPGGTVTYDAGVDEPQADPANARLICRRDGLYLVSFFVEGQLSIAGAKHPRLDFSLRVDQIGGGVAIPFRDVVQFPKLNEPVFTAYGFSAGATHPVVLRNAATATAGQGTSVFLFGAGLTADIFPAITRQRLSFCRLSSLQGI